MNGELWLRPWAYYAPGRRLKFDGGSAALPENHDGPPLFWSTGKNGPSDGARLTSFRVAVTGGQWANQIDSAVWDIPLPLRTEKGVSLGKSGEDFRLYWPALPDRPAKISGDGDPDEPGRQLMLRAEAVWDRIQDVDDALADPARLWETLYRQWTGQDADEPRMDVIVKQARELARVLEYLERHPRRILRRTHGMVPIDRVQEVDRRAMLWMARQPGDTLAEKAGMDQRLFAVRREENFDTLENRVLRSYVELAKRHAQDYLDRNKTLSGSKRARSVDGHRRRCGRLAGLLARLGVRRADPSITPNFVLLHNQNYRNVWNAWIELLRLERVKDNLWRWQARSWQEFCRLAIMVSLAGGLKTGQLVAASPMRYRGEQQKGNWIEMPDPLGVVHLPDASRIVEVATTAPKETLARLGASIWLRIGTLGDTSGFLRRVAVWPIWSQFGGLSKGEDCEVRKIVEEYHADEVVGAIIMRPATDSESPAVHQNGPVLTLTLGTEGRALTAAMAALVGFLSEKLEVETQ